MKANSKIILEWKTTVDCRTNKKKITKEGNAHTLKNVTMDRTTQQHKKTTTTNNGN